MNACYVEGCERPGVERSPDKLHHVCKAHAARIRRHGDPFGGRLPSGTLCAVEDCDRKQYCRGFCGLHYSRWQRHGDPLKYIANDNRVPHTSYVLAHARLKSARGSASTYECAGNCGAQARDWSYKGAAPDEQWDTNSRGIRVPFSEDFDYYEPLCRTCHRRRDWSDKITGCKRGHEWTVENTAYYPNGGRRCRACSRERYEARKRRRKEAA